MKLSRLTLAIAILPGLALAAANTDSLELKPSVVTRATNLNLPTASSVAVIDRAIMEDSGALSLIDLLRSQAGLQIRDTMGDGNRASISLRGFGENAGNNTLVLVDGRRLNQPTLVTPDLNSVPLANIERIEIIRGAGTVLYGDQAVGGVINIVTRTPDTREAYIEAGLGNNDLEAYRGHIYQPLGAGFSVYASGEKRNTDHYRKHNNESYDNAFGRLRYDHGTGHLLYEYQRTDQDLKFPDGLSLAQRRDDRKQSFSQSWNDATTEVNRLALAQQLGNVWTASVDYSDSDQDGKGSFGPGSEFDQSTRIKSFNPRLTAQFESLLGQAEWLLGYDQITSNYKYLTAWGDTRAEQKLRDWYTQFNQQLDHNLNLILGFRSSKVQDDDSGANREHNDRQNSTSVGLNWQATQQVRVFIKREDILRWANVDEYSFVSPGVDFLRPQTGQSWESGVEWQDGLQRYQATVYRMKLDNELMYDPEATGPNSIFGYDGANINLDKTLRQGLLLEAERQLTNRFSIGSQYSFTDAEYRAGNFKGKDVPWVSPHSASAHAGYDIVPGLKGYVEAVYTGKRYYSNDDANTARRAGSYTTFNAALGYDYQQFNSKLRVNNLTGKKYDAFGSSGYRYPAPEEQVQLSVGYRF